jgi:predicted transcriptional regulator
MWKYSMIESFLSKLKKYYGTARKKIYEIVVSYKRYGAQLKYLANFV